MWDPNEEEKDKSEVIEGLAQFKRLNMVELQGIHEHHHKLCGNQRTIHVCASHEHVEIIVRDPFAL
jgi:hypothetical protein